MIIPSLNSATPAVPCSTRTETTSNLRARLNALRRVSLRSVGSSMTFRTNPRLTTSAGTKGSLREVEWIPTCSLHFLTTQIAHVGAVSTAKIEKGVGTGYGACRRVRAQPVWSTYSAGLQFSLRAWRIKVSGKAVHQSTYHRIFQVVRGCTREGFRNWHLSPAAGE